MARKKPTMGQIIEFLKAEYFIDEGEWDSIIESVQYYWDLEE